MKFSWNLISPLGDRVYISAFCFIVIQKFHSLVATLSDIKDELKNADSVERHASSTISAVVCYNLVDHLVRYRITPNQVLTGIRTHNFSFIWSCLSNYMTSKNKHLLHFKRQVDHQYPLAIGHAEKIHTVQNLSELTGCLGPGIPKECIAGYSLQHALLPLTFPPLS